MPAPLILVVDDNEVHRFACRVALERAGFTVATAEDGRAALALIHRHPPDAVVLDLNMPVLDGWQTARALALDPRTAGLRVIAHTAEPVRDPVRLRQAGFCAFADKMIGTRRLVELVRRVLASEASDSLWVETPPPDVSALSA